MADCREQCTTITQACLKNIEPLVDEHYNTALKRHEAELERHSQQQVHYDLYLALNRGYPWRHGFWSLPYHYPPAPR